MENNQKEIILLKDLGMLHTSETKKYKARFGLYKCFCGNEFKARITHIKNKYIKSCKCLQGKNHNLSNHRLYTTWHHMVERCNNENSFNYFKYGGRGIAVCDEWLNVENFIKDMYPTYLEGLTLDRKNNNLGYSKENCRWASKATQSRNTKKLHSTNTSGYRGVSWSKKDKKWRARIKINSKEKSLGSFYNPIDAAKAYDNYVLSNNLEHTRNFN